jgi:hypothetical protein
MPSPTFTINGVECALHIEGFGERAFVETHGPQGKQATMMIKCAYDDKPALMIGLLGTVTFTASRTIVRSPPFQYPADTSGMMVCTSVTDFFGQNFATDQTSGLGLFDDCIMGANFSVPSYDPGGSSDLSHYPYVTTRMRTSTEVFAPPKGGFFFAGDVGKPLGVAGPGFIRPHTEIQSTRHWMPYPFVQLAESLVGQVNDRPMVFADKTYAKGTILFVNSDIEPTSDPATGLRTFDIPLHLLANDNIDWNYFIDNDGEYTKVTTAGVDGRPVYGYADLTQLFKDSF